MYKLTLMTSSASQGKALTTISTNLRRFSGDQRVSIRQFVQRVEQLNSYIAQLPCWYYSPSVKVKTVPMNMSFTEADLASHVLQMCPYTWQDQYNLHEKGGAPTDIRSLLQSLEAIEHVCGQEGSSKSNPSCDKKASHIEKKGTKRPGTESPRVPKKVRTKKHCDLCKKHGGAHTTHNTRDCRRFEKDGTFRAAKKGRKSPNPTKQSFAQLGDKLDTLEKVLKKRIPRSGSAAVGIAIPTPNRELDRVA
jgi:hypothetical protein